MSPSISKRNNVKIIGSGDRTLMLAHGFGCDQNMWRYVVPAFENDYRIVLFDYVGCGKSDQSAYNPNRYNNLNGYAQDIIEVAEELQLTNVTFVGHSVSCIIGILAYIQKPGLFNSMILIGPSPRYINDETYQGGFSQGDLEELLDVMEKNYIGWANFLAPIVMKNDERPELTQELEESFCSTDPVITKRFARVTFFSDNRSDLSKVDIPVLVLQCSEDAIAPDFVGEYVAERIIGSKYVKMEATGHCPHLSHPEETIHNMKNFLTELQAVAKHE